jgi:hypothetical protein
MNDLDGRWPGATLPRSGEGRAVNEIVREADTALLCRWKAGTCWHGGPCYSELGNVGDPCAPVLGGEDGRAAAAARRRRLS